MIQVVLVGHYNNDILAIFKGEDSDHLKLLRKIGVQSAQGQIRSTNDRAVN